MQTKQAEKKQTGQQAEKEGPKPCVEVKPMMMDRD